MVTRVAPGALFILLMAVLAACRPTGSSTQPDPKSPSPDEQVSVMVDSVNYMVDRATKYTLYDLSQPRPQAVGGAIVRMLASGGEKGCCLSLPQHWHAGMKVRLDWTESDFERIFPEKYSREFEIPKYAKPGDLYVVFYPKNEVEIVVSFGEPGSEEWQGRIKATPWENCLANNEQKACKATLPKRFNKRNAQGFCTYTKSPDYPGTSSEGEELCAFSLQECVSDYEDEQMCKSILWGARKK